MKVNEMKLTRREVLGVSASSAFAMSSGLSVVSAYSATEPTAEDRIKEFTGGAEVAEGKLDLTTPEIAENGNTVPIAVEVDSPMTDEDHVNSVMILADGNPNPDVVTFNFSKGSGIAAAKTRIRLAKTQNIIAVAKMSDGSFQMAKAQVKVTIGGCGG